MGLNIATYNRWKDLFKKLPKGPWTPIHDYSKKVLGEPEKHMLLIGPGVEVTCTDPQVLEFIYLSQIVASESHNAKVSIR